MKLKTFLGMCALWVVVFSSSDGTPMEIRERPGTKRRGKHHYTIEEENLISEIVLAHGGVSCQDTWNAVEAEHERKLQARKRGFKKRRTGTNMSKHFFNKMVRGKGLGPIPEALKEILRNRKYYQAENDLINEELLSWPGGSIYNSKLWEKMARKHDLKRNNGEDGFYARRTPYGLYSHFRLVMIPKEQVSEAVKRKYPANLGNIQDRSGEGPSQVEEQSTKQSEDQFENELQNASAPELRENEIEFIDFFERELLTASEPEESQTEELDDDNDEELTKLKL